MSVGLPAMNIETLPLRCADKKSSSSIGRIATEGAFELSVTLDDILC